MIVIGFGPEGMIDNRTGLLVDENTYLPEYSAGGDYYRKVSDLTKAENLPYWRGAGASHQYQYFKDTDPGEGKTWTQIDPGEHDEQASYFWAGLNTPQYVEALNKSAAERTALENARLAHPDAVGQASVRNEYSLTGGTNEDDWRQELAFLQAYRPDLAGTISEAYTPEMKAAIAQQLAKSTPESQSTREGPSFMDDVFTNIIPGMLAVVGGVNAMGSLAGLGEAAAETGALEAALPEALGEAGGYDFVSNEAAGALEQLGGGNLVEAGSAALPTEFVSSTNTAPYTPDYGTLADAQAAVDVGASDLSSMGIGAEVTGSIPAMDTLGSTSWLESAINSLKAGDTSWLSPNVSPSQLKSVVSSVLGGDAATTPAKTTKPATANAGAFSGMYPVSQGKSALEAMMSGEDGNSLDEFMRLMAQSGKGA